MKARKPCHFHTTAERELLRYLLIVPLMFLSSGSLLKSEEKTADKADALSSAIQNIESKIDKAGGHYVRAEYAEVVSVLDGLDKEIDALVAQHPDTIGEWMPTMRKAIVYAMLTKSYKKQSAHYEALFNKRWGKVVKIEEFLRGVLRDKEPQLGVEFGVGPAPEESNKPGE